MKFWSFVCTYVLSLAAFAAAQTTSSASASAGTSLAFTAPANNTVYTTGQTISIAWTTADTSCQVCLSVKADTGQVTSLGCNAATTTSSSFTIPAGVSVGSYWLVATQCTQTAQVRIHIGVYSTYTVNYTSTTTSTLVNPYTTLVTITTTAYKGTSYIVETTLVNEYNVIPYTITTNLVETVLSVGYVAA